MTRQKLIGSPGGVKLAGQNSGIKYDRQLQQLNMQNQARLTQQKHKISTNSHMFLNNLS